MKPKLKKYPELDFDSDLPAELDVLLDTPPVTNRDDANLHELIFMGLAHVVKPRDFIEWLIVRDMADHRYEITWGRRLMSGVVRRVTEDYILVRQVEACKPYKDEVKKLNAEVRADLAKQISQLKGEPEKIKADTARLRAEAKTHLESAGGKLRQKAHKEADHQKRSINNALEDVDFLEYWISPYEQLSGLVQRAEQKFDNDLRRLDEYRHGLGESLRKSIREVIDVEVEEIDLSISDISTNNRGAATSSSAPLSPEGSSVQARVACSSATTAETPLSSEEEAAGAPGRSAAAVTCADGQLASASESAQTPTTAAPFPDEPRSPEES
jgi:hypothetical protein